MQININIWANTRMIFSLTIGNFPDYISTLYNNGNKAWVTLVRAKYKDQWTTLGIIILADNTFWMKCRLELEGECPRVGG